MNPIMMDNGELLLIPSVAAFDGQMGQVAYAASKGAIGKTFFDF
jgi:short-subunit dehydrogenase